jgi:hypothetical protein
MKKATAPRPHFEVSAAKERQAMRAAKYRERVQRLRDVIRSALDIKPGETCLFVARRATPALIGRKVYDYTAIDGMAGDLVCIAGMSLRGFPDFVRAAFRKRTKVIYYYDSDIIGVGRIACLERDSMKVKLDVVLDPRTRDNIRFERDCIYEMFRGTSEFSEARVATAATVKHCTVCGIIGSSVKRGVLTNSFVELANH